MTDQESSAVAVARAGRQGMVSRRRLLLLTQNLNLRGAQRQIVELALGLDRSRYDVRMGTLEPGGELASDLGEARIPMISFPRRWRWDMSVARRLTSYLRTEQIQIVHAFQFLPNLYSRLAGRLARTPAVISSLRGTGIEGWHRYLADICTCRLCDELIANSEAGRSHYVRWGGPRDKVTVIRNGMGFRRLLADQRTGAEPGILSGFDQRVGMVASLEKRKDQGLLLRAMRHVLSARQETGLVLVGEGSRREGLERLARSLKIDRKVVFTGQLQRPGTIYRCLDVYVQASHHGEGISNSILEAMASGLPVVATDVGGNSEVVIDGETGIIVPRSDPRALAEAILDLLSSRSKRRRFGLAGRERAKTDFSLGRMVAATEQVYDRLLGLSSGTSRTTAGRPAGAR